MSRGENELERLTEDVLQPAWRRRTQDERRWPVSLAVVVIIALQVTLPEGLTLGPRWLLPAIEVAMVAALVAADPVRIRRDTPRLRMLALALIAVASLGNAWSVAMLVRQILTGRETGTAAELIMVGGAVYLLNILSFAIWFWELDRGGPARRASGTDPYPDFLFPPMTTPELAPKDWEPYFLDYLYVAFTNATAFSPTDTLPMSRWAKAAMGLESAIALLIAILLIAKAVNSLG
ncbi:hypothetical protein [Actinoplanes solisilvae]|uniref:hypothetical protein n=1 Tax=Actinoplanes solisilvae TaxID=2486853 RepID=UPI001F0CDB1F|nr:hypothetical protein [Actinoplanes solisilvae]